MDIFSEFEGLRGENLASSVLRYLIFNSHEIRDAFLALLSDHSPIGPLSYSTLFACRTEYPTSSEIEGGRLDILIQLDDVVIGIENKFFAEFQDGQPEKYCDTLETAATSLGDINHTSTKALLFVLCPKSRKSEAKKKISALKTHAKKTPAAVVLWEKVLKTISDTETVSNPTTKIVAQEFCSYLERHLSFIEKFKSKAAHLKRTFPDYGSPYQRELVSRLWSIFPAAGRRLSFGKTWLGYYFYDNPEIKQEGWFGFVPGEEITIGGKQSNNKAELLIASTYAPKLSSSFRSVEFELGANWLRTSVKANFWVIEFDAEWGTVDVWREKLRPFWQAVGGDVT